jgi:hypothetical protein
MPLVPRWVILLVLALAAGGPGTTLSGCKKFESLGKKPDAGPIAWTKVTEPGLFDIEFPLPPRRSTIDGSDSAIELASWPYHLTFRKLTTRVSLQNEGAVCDSAAMAAAQTFIRDHNGQLLAKRDVKIGEHTGIETEVSVDKDPLFGTYHWRVFVVGDRLFQLYVYAERAKQTDVQKFFRSFRLYATKP